jgi:hypothetical protein
MVPRKYWEAARSPSCSSRFYAKPKQEHAETEVDGGPDGERVQPRHPWRRRHYADGDQYAEDRVDPVHRERQER